MMDVEGKIWALRLVCKAQQHQKEKDFGFIKAFSSCLLGPSGQNK